MTKTIYPSLKGLKVSPLNGSSLTETLSLKLGIKRCRGYQEKLNYMLSGGATVLGKWVETGTMERVSALQLLKFLQHH